MSSTQPLPAATAGPPSTAPRIYLPGLDGLRFVAAFAVIVHHVEQWRSIAGFSNHWDLHWIKSLGGLGVTLFFVLSGFLITYLLLVERNWTGTIAVRDFYVRRVLRIWPLYYVLVIVGFSLGALGYVPPGQRAYAGEAIGKKLAAFVLLCPNLALVLLQPVRYIAHLWSVGTEEQFYLLWPWLVRAARDRVLIALGAVIAFVGVLRWGAQSGALEALTGLPRAAGLLGDLLDLLRVDCMAIGGLGAYVLYRRSVRLLSIVFHPATQLVTYAALVLLIVFYRGIPVVYHQVSSTLFLVLLLNVSSNPHTFSSMEHPVFRFMGRISYGLYMYHPLVIIALLTVFRPVLATMSGFAADAVTHLSALLTTTGVAAASYYGLERPFLRLKPRFARVASGDDARGRLDPK